MADDTATAWRYSSQAQTQAILNHSRGDASEALGAPCCAGDRRGRGRSAQDEIDDDVVAEHGLGGVAPATKLRSVALAALTR